MKGDEAAGPTGASNVGKWDSWYRDLDVADMGAFRYGDTVTYQMAAAFMADVDEVEDWGCGAGGFKRFYRGRYTGVDGSHTPFADRIVDLCTYTSSTEGIVMRHVLEHNEDWRQVLDSAVRSFTRKFFLVLFTPFSDTTHEIAHNRAHGVDVPDLSFRRSDIEERLAGLRWELIEEIPTDTGYGVEHVYLVWRDGGGSAAGKPGHHRVAAWRARARRSLDAVSSRAERLEPVRRVRGLERSRTAPRRAVYTAIFGGYDGLNDVPVGADQGGIAFVCFTDDEQLIHPQWQVRVVEPRYEHPRLAAKHFKALSHAVLPEYDQTLWVDGSFRIDDANFPHEAFEYLEQADMALFLHPDRGCVYDEAEVCQDMPKYADHDVLGQVAHYRRQGYPAKAGLFAGGVIARTKDPEVAGLNELWMQENIARTYQDQLSLPYLMWKLDCRPAIFRQYLWSTRWGEFEAHAHEK